MALGATVHRLRLDVADIDRAVYDQHVLTVARHPSETEERMMIRVLAFAMYADPSLQFGRGLSTDDEPDLWLHSDDGQLRSWIDVGLPEERRLRRASGRAQRVVVIAFGGNRVDVWWQRNRAAMTQLASLTVWSVPPEESAQLTALASRSMRLSVTLQEGSLLFSDGERTAELSPRRLHPGAS
ncbi:MAG: YaeQ family protein [Burkholderiaceae bacterium]